MTTARPVLHILALNIALTYVCLAQEPTGPVSSQPPSSRSGATTGVSDVKDLPWKVLAGPEGVLDPAGWKAEDLQKFANPSNWPTTQSAAEALVRTTAGPGPSKPAYVVIHVFDYTAGPGSSDAWYLFRSKDPKWGDPRWGFQKFTGQRIYGSHVVSFVFTHLHVKAIALDEVIKIVSRELDQAQADDDKVRREIGTASSDKDVGDKLAAQGMNPAYVLALSKANLALPKDDKARKAALRDMVVRNAVVVPNASDPSRATQVPICESDTGLQYQWFENYGIPSNYINVHYESAVVKRTPANVSNFLDILKILGLAQAKQTCIAIDRQKEVDVVLWGKGRMQQIGLPSDITIAGYSVGANQPLNSDERTTKLIGSTGAYNDEQLYWWDASIGIPVHKIKDLQYSTADNTVVASHVDRQSAYAMFNLMLHPVDLSDPKSNVWPRILVGFPLSSSPWDRLFTGGGVGVPLRSLQHFQFFAGATFNRTKQPATLTAGSSANNAELQNDLRIVVEPKFTFGINVPVKSVLDKLLK